MGLELSDSVVLITGSEPNRFGTGFAIHQDEHATYLLTCAHVVDDVGGPAVLKAGNDTATVIASDTEDGFDLAVLRVEKLLEIPLLNLSISGETGRSFITAGFWRDGKKILLQQLEGTLAKPGLSVSRKLGSRSTAWHLEVDDAHYLQSGYSGAPVVDETSGDVLGVISQRRGEGKKGLAISIEALKEIWRERPKPLLGEDQTPVTKPAFLPTEPVMNLQDELDVFEKMATGQDTQTRLILVHGEGGMGKTHLLNLYEQVAEANSLDLIKFNLGSDQQSIESFIYKIACHFGLKHFPNYHQFLLDALPLGSSSETREREWWLHNLTRNFFIDLGNCTRVSRLAVFFDKYQDLDPLFTIWLPQIFLPNISTHYPIIIVIAGRDEIKPDFSKKSFRHFHLNGVTVDWYHRYAEECNVQIDPDMISALHKALRGQPLAFANLVQSLKSGGAR